MEEFDDLEINIETSEGVHEDDSADAVERHQKA